MSSSSGTAMALPAGGLDAPCWKDGRSHPSALRCASPTVRARPAAMAHGAAELVPCCVRDYRMPAERLCADIGKTGFFQSDVASGAAIYDSELRKPDLLDPAVVGSGAASVTAARGSEPDPDICSWWCRHSLKWFLAGAMASEINKSRLTTPKARTGWPNNVCHRCGRQRVLR